MPLRTNLSVRLSLGSWRRGNTLGSKAVVASVRSRCHCTLQSRVQANDSLNLFRSQRWLLSGKTVAAALLRSFEHRNGDDDQCLGAIISVMRATVVSPE